MPKIRSILGYMWAGAAIIVVFATFLGSSVFGRALVAASGVKISPWYSGGEVVLSVDHGVYRTHVHRPVFDALIGEKSEGFIQLNWEPLAGLLGRRPLPGVSHRVARGGRRRAGRV